RSWSAASSCTPPQRGGAPRRESRARRGGWSASSYLLLVESAGSSPKTGMSVVGNIARSLRQPHRLEVVSGIGQLPLVLSVQVHRVNVGASTAARRVDDLLSIRRPRRMAVRPLRRELYGLTGREVHQADVEVPLVAAGEGDPGAVGRPGGLVVPVSGERHPAGARPFRVDHVDLRVAGLVRRIEN